MRRLSLFLRWTLPIILILAATGFAASTLQMRAEVEHAQEHYDIAALELARVTAQLEENDRKLSRLTTDVGAVEEEVRRELRMVHPGETLMLIQREETIQP